MTEAPSVIRTRGLTKRYGQVLAVDGIDLDGRAGDTYGFLGPNGSGKTTVFNLIDGTYPLSAGRIDFDEQRIDQLGPTRRTFAGIGRTYQLPRLFESLTVLQNVAVAVGEFRPAHLLRSAVSGAEAARAKELLEFVGLGEFLDALASDLSYGQRKLVELAQVLMLDPQLILLDEPCAGINPTLIRRMAELIRALNRAGQTFLIVEHDMNFVLSLCDPVVVLSRGTVIANGTADSVSADVQVREAYLGEDFVLDSALAGGTT